MHNLLTEEVNFRVFQLFNKETKKPYFKLQVWLPTSKNIDKYKDLLLKYKAIPDQKYKNVYFWWLSGNKEEAYPELAKIATCIKAISNREKTIEDNPRSFDQIIKSTDWGKLLDKFEVTIDQLIKDLENSPEPTADEEEHKPDDIYKTKEQVLTDLKSLKEKLFNITTSEEFVKIIEPYIKFNSSIRKFRKRYSFSNTILIFIQDPKAKFVLSVNEWKKANKEIIPGSKAIGLWCPRSKSTPISDEEKQKLIKDFLTSKNKENEEELTDSEKKELEHLIYRKTHTIVGFTFEYRFYDVRYTKQMEGKPEIFDSGDNLPTLDWFDDKTPATEKTEKLYEAVKKLIIKNKISLEERPEKELDGARGYSTSDGKIVLIKSDTHNQSDVSTAVHELSHALLHQTYVQTNNPELKQYYVGRDQGRNIIEVQAELSAWIVLGVFDIPMKTNVNYMGIWGSREDIQNATPEEFANIFMKAFDAVSNTATYIIDGMLEELNPQQNKKLTETDDSNDITITPYDVAKLIGMQDMYLKVKRYLDNKNKK